MKLSLKNTLSDRKINSISPATQFYYLQPTLALLYNRPDGVSLYIKP
jgi:hypothetical protein